MPLRCEARTRWSRFRATGGYSVWENWFEPEDEKELRPRDDKVHEVLLEEYFRPDLPASEPKRLCRDMIRLILTAAVLHFLSHPAAAGFAAGADLREYCRSFSDTCAGYIMGSIDAQAPALKGFVCLPPNFNAAAAILTVREYLETHPQVSETDGSVVVLGALASRYRCS